MRVFRLLKQSERDALQQHAGKAVERWAAEWGIEPADLGCRVQADHQPFPTADITLAVRQGEQALAFLCANTTVAGRLASRVFAAPVTAPSQTGHAVLRLLLERLLGSWLLALVQDGSPGSLSVAAVDALPLEGRACDTVNVALLLGESEIGVVALPVASLQRLGLLRPAQRRPSGGLTARAAAVMPAKARIIVQVAEAGLTIAELRAMAVGDVIVLDRPLAKPLPVTVGAQPVAHAYPGRCGENLAIELCSNPKP